MRLLEINGYEIHLPTSGGKAGKGCAVTSSIQVRADGCIKKNIRFKLTDNGESRASAIQKARTYINNHPLE